MIARSAWPSMKLVEVSRSELRPLLFTMEPYGKTFTGRHYSKMKRSIAMKISKTWRAPSIKMNKIYKKKSNIQFWQWRRSNLAQLTNFHTFTQWRLWRCYRNHEKHETKRRHCTIIIADLFLFLQFILMVASLDDFAIFNGVTFFILKIWRPEVVLP